MTRHKLIATSDKLAACDCGYNPHIIDAGPLDWAEGVRAVLAHIKKARRWKYLGTEVHYGSQYHLWENGLTKRRYAWEVETYRATHSRRLVAA